MDNAHPPKLLYPSMVIAAVAVTVFSLLGIATLTGALPLAHGQTIQSGYGIDEITDESQAKTQINSRTDKPEVKKPAIRCAHCGVVESVRAVEVKGKGSGIGAVAGGITGALLGNGIGQGNGRTAVTILGAAGGAYAGNEIEKNTKKHTSYRIRVLMSDNSIRTVIQRDASGISAGDRVRIVDGAVVLQS